MRVKDILNDYQCLPEYFDITLVHVNQVTWCGDRPINVAATRGNIADMEALVCAGASVNSPGDEGYTPLHNAVEQGMVEAVKWLLSHGADRGVANALGMTPRDLAVALNETALFELLGEEIEPAEGGRRTMFPTGLTSRFESIRESGSSPDLLGFLAPYVERGDGEALYLSATVMLASEVPDERRISALREAARLAYIPAVFTLGMDLLFGTGVEQDVQSAARCFEQAAEAGMPAAMYEWGLALLHGKGVPEDVPRAMMFIRTAAADGDEYAQEFLATYYGTG